KSWTAPSIRGSLASQFETILDLLKDVKVDEPIELVLPDLIRLVGAETAERLIAKAVRTPSVRLTLRAQGATVDLTRRLMLEAIDSITKPNWDLAEAPEGVALYEAMRKRFPRVTHEQSEAARKRREAIAKSPVGGMVDSSQLERSEDADKQKNRDSAEADCAYLLYLIAEGRRDEATSLALDLSESAGSYYLRSLSKRYSGGRLVELRDFLAALLKKKPELEFWDGYIEMAQKTGRAQEAIFLLQEAMKSVREKSGKESYAMSRLRDSLITLLLAQDRVEEAVALIREKASAQTGDDSHRYKRLLNLGDVLQRPAWVKEAFPYCGRLFYSGAKEELYEDEMPIAWRAGLAADIETTVSQLLFKSIKDAKRSHTKPEEFGPYDDALKQLIMIYDAAGRSADVLMLLARAPWWNQKDLNEISSNKGFLAAAARALAAAGRKDEAARILKSVIYDYPGYDPAYQTLADFSGPDLIPWLDELLRRRPFEERPLIWKAYILLKARRLDEAEKAAREALKIDPTDGEQPTGDRARAYAVLADILTARGNNNEAANFRKVVEAVREGEKGDALAGAGLMKRARASYEKSQNTFADAYCVLWRLAQRMQDEGDPEGARKYYRQAFERMPGQFGRITQRRSGCENFFDDRGKRSLAEEVLLKAAQANSNQPQLYYLIGQLREKQMRNEEAYAAYRRAVDLDPEYVDAWRALFDIASKAFLTRAEQDAIALRLLALDPFGPRIFYAYRDFRNDLLYEIADLKGLWRVTSDNRRLAVLRPKSLLSLPAAKARLDALEAKRKGEGRSNDHEEDETDSANPREYGDLAKPGDVLKRTQIVEMLQMLMGERADLRRSYFSDDLRLNAFYPANMVSPAAVNTWNRYF
ncbi:MAG: hypothetical protein NTX50_13910, partial [Candidatus Sumerlaeota bacterium]|nr:hypothetical protein [Candidatus Sumerlaeota bacterium]